MLRYNMSAPGGKLMVALENPEDGFGSESYGDQSYPDLVARYQTRGNYGFYSVAALLRFLEDVDFFWVSDCSVSATSFASAFCSL